MKLLIEEYAYETSRVADVVAGLIDSIELSEPRISLNYVGYFFNKRLGDCVFILPKVIIDEYGKVFREFSPEDLIDLENATQCVERRAFLHNLLVWIYRAISVYVDSNPQSRIILKKAHPSSGKGHYGKCHTLFDVILALMDFNKEHRDFVTLVLKNTHSGVNKINWTRTVSRSFALLQDGDPFYSKVVNKRKEINFEDELLVIHFSILRYVHEKYGFEISILPGFELITGSVFRQYLNGLGKKRLNEIKYRYFSDTALRLWELCAAFFDLSKIVRSGIGHEYLLAKNFNIVFEAMIDELIGDKDIPRDLKEQADGKRVDHLYRDRGLIEYDQNDTYYIGDSKYYKLGHVPGKESVYKQYTYAKNVVQYNLDLFMDETRRAEQMLEPVKQLRDDVTEGYNVIPNFFISADIDRGRLTYEERLVERNGNAAMPMNRQFENRLFDRDTILLSHFNVNFLHVLSLYARNIAGQKAQWRTKVRACFRAAVQKRLGEQFDFWVMRARVGIDGDDYLRKNLQWVLGKVFTPFASHDVYSLALERNEKYAKENEALLNRLSDAFHMARCGLGHNPEEAFTSMKSEFRKEVKNV